MEKITREEVMEKLHMFQSIFGEIDEFGWWDLERISADAGTQFTSTEFKEECQTHGVHLTLEAPEHQEINGKVEVTWRTLRAVALSYGTCWSFGSIYSFCVNVYGRSNISRSTNQRSDK